MPEASIIPCLRYRDAPAAIDFLCRAFGFERHLVVEGKAGTIAHAQLTYGHGMIMLGSLNDGAWGALICQPEAIGRTETQTPYVVVPDVDAHHLRAVTAGAMVVIPPKDEPYGGRGYTCRDPEGHIWSFGSYNPWQAAAAAEAAA